MARQDAHTIASAGDADDAFMDLFNDKDATFDDLVDAMDTDNGASPDKQSARRTAQSAITQELLGIDEEVKIKKVRKPVVKLDESRLTSAAGISKLQKISRTKLKFRGKGHEFSDVAVLLRTYQLWLHDLYPRAKFNDGLIMLEKLGHTKSVQRLRSDWINQSKPNAYDHRSDQSEDDNPENREVEDLDRINLEESSLEAAAGSGNRPDILRSFSPLRTSHSVVDGKDQHEEPDEDELDALLAEEEQLSRETQDAQSTFKRPNHLQGTEQRQSHDDFSHDEEIMREMDMWDD